MATKIDTCGLSCPQPVLMFMNEVKKDADGEFDVLVDTDASKENVTRAARNHGFKVEPVDEGNDVVRLEIRRK